MALTTLQIIEVRSPVIFGQSAINTMIEYAEEQLDETCWGDKYANAVALLTMHNYTVDSRGGAGGPVTSEKDGIKYTIAPPVASMEPYQPKELP